MIYKVLFALAVIFLLVACETEEVEVQDNSQFIETETPQGAIDLAIQVATDKCALLPGDECQDFRLACSEPAELTKSDEAENVESKWCLAIEYQKRSPTISSEWKDNEINLSVENHGDSWEEEGFCICGLEAETESSESSENE